MVAATESASFPEIPRTSKNKAQENTLWGLINNYRLSHGLTSWEKDLKLCEFVYERLGQLQKNGTLDNHAGFQSQTPLYLGQKGFRKLVENIAEGYASQGGIIDGWIGSLPHRSVLLSTEMTVACAENAYGFGVLIGGRR